MPTPEHSQPDPNEIRSSIQRQLDLNDANENIIERERMRDALPEQLDALEAETSDTVFHPVAWVSTQDLLNCRPDLADRIQALDSAAVEVIARKVGDALQASYGTALQGVLTEFFGSPAPSND